MGPFVRIVLVIQVLCSSLLAQSVPDAGSVRREVEERQNIELPLNALPEGKETSESTDSGPRVKVDVFEFVGNELLGDDRLAAVVEGFIGRELFLSDLNQVAARVGEAYQTAGLLARVFLPEQEIVNGRVLIQVEEAKFGKLDALVDETNRLRSRIAEAYFLNNQTSGEYLDLRKIDRALLLLDDLPGVTATGEFVQGQNVGETDLRLSLADMPFFGGEVSMDNQGSRGTGKERFVLDLYLNSPLRYGDLLTANALYSQGNTYLRSAYSMPVGSTGLRAGVSGSWLEYEIVTEDFADLGIEGSSRTAGVNIQYPVLRARNRNLYLNASYETTAYENEANAVTTSAYDSRVFALGVTGNVFDTLWGGGANFVNLTFSSGTIDLGDIDFNELSELDGEFTKFSFLLSRQQAMTRRLSAYVALSGQYADSNLDSSEKFYLGGPYGVRAYPVNEGGGDHGLLANLELRYIAHPDWVLTTFYDWGHVKVNRNNAFDTSPNTFELDGAGISVSWRGPRSLSVNATYARRIGDNPNALETGEDQDGSLTRNRFWLSVGLPF